MMNIESFWETAKKFEYHMKYLRETYKRSPTLFFISEYVYFIFIKDEWQRRTQMKEILQ